MTDGFVPIASEDATVYEFEVGKKHLFAVKFGDHYEWAKLWFEPFRKASTEYCFSFIESVPCCEDAHDHQIVDKFFDSLISRRFPLGEWLKAPRERHPAATGHEPCKDRNQHASRILNPYTVDKAQRELEALASSWKEDQPAKRKRKGEEETKTPAKKKTRTTLERARTIYRQVQKIVPSDASDKEELQDLKLQAEEAKCLEFFASSIETGIKNLQKSHDHEARQQYLPFGTLIQYRKSQHNGSGESLRQALDAFGSIIRLDSKDANDESEKAIWTHTLLSENTRLIERAENPTHSAMGSSSELDWKDKQKEKRSKILNIIVNGLREKFGIHAWGVLSALRETHPSLRDFYKIRDDRVDNFAKSAIERIKHCKLETIPENAPSIHLPAVLSWLLRKRFDTVCRYLHLDGFAEENPGIDAELDKLASQYEGLEDNDETTRALLETRGGRLMALSLSRLKASDGDVVPYEARQRIQHADSDSLRAQSTSNNSRANETPTRLNFVNDPQQSAQASTGSSPHNGRQDAPAYNHPLGIQNHCHSITLGTQEQTDRRRQAKPSEAGSMMPLMSTLLDIRDLETGAPTNSTPFSERNCSTLYEASGSQRSSPGPVASALYSPMRRPSASAVQHPDTDGANHNDTSLPSGASPSPENPQSQDRESHEVTRSPQHPREQERRMSYPPEMRPLREAMAIPNLPGPCSPGDTTGDHGIDQDQGLPSNIAAMFTAEEISNQADQFGQRRLSQATPNRVGHRQSSPLQNASPDIGSMTSASSATIENTISRRTQHSASDGLSVQSTFNNGRANQAPSRSDIENSHQQPPQASTSSSPYDSRESIQPDNRAENTHPLIVPPDNTRRSSLPSPNQPQPNDDLSSHRSTNPKSGASFPTADNAGFQGHGLHETPVATGQIGDFAERDSAHEDGFSTMDARDGAEAQSQGEDFQPPSPTPHIAPAQQYQPQKSSCPNSNRTPPENSPQEPLNHSMDTSAVESKEEGDTARNNTSPGSMMPLVSTPLDIRELQTGAQAQSTPSSERDHNTPHDASGNTHSLEAPRSSAPRSPTLPPPPPNTNQPLQFTGLSAVTSSAQEQVGSLGFNLPNFLRGDTTSEIRSGSDGGFRDMDFMNPTNPENFYDLFFNLEGNTQQASYDMGFMDPATPEKVDDMFFSFVQ